ncbi:LPS export ABC transporter periplasmic protein LptC [Candidatus Pelagibacter sp.]|jgi:hypothetical protein|nr:LPS export ABC transporter periplasmic protein LptC [Candidatus Pelagibacter sp.]
MNSKTSIQILLVFLIITISLWFYFKYFNDTSKILDKNLIVKEVETDKLSNSTFIDNINYVASDLENNKYLIAAKKAEIKIENPNIMFLTDVTANILIKNSEIIKITSDFGKYNSKNYDTIFTKNIIITYLKHKITGEHLDFSFLNGYMTISKNVIYKGEKTSLLADKIEIDLTTKDTKIFMIDNNKKVLIEGNK